MKTHPGLRLRLELLNDSFSYRYRWELLGKYSRWVKSKDCRRLTVERAFERLRHTPILGD